MSAVFALPAAVRLPRTVAVRRALLAGLFLVGFVALGFAFGPGAHADDRTDAPALTGAASPAPAEASLPDRAATRAGAADRFSGSQTALERRGKATGAEIADGTHDASAAVTEAVESAAEQTAPVTGRITQPVSRIVREVGDSAGAVHLPAGEHANRPGDGAEQQHGRTPQGMHPSGQPRCDASADGGAANRLGHLSDGLHESAAGQSVTVVHEQRDPGHQGLPGQLPQGQTAPASHTAGDGHGPRGGDQHAAAPADFMSLRLLPGGVRTADGAPTRMRAEEILEFPG
ncbi:hypothetical protein ACGFOU_28510 [Streptomyces sp. NPDC048595]|uniref:hypothetical protein n=1 Tax=Streptomyces sp. NPDC048595 TaxID=3365576 RepID=UPI003710EFD2